MQPASNNPSSRIHLTPGTERPSAAEYGSDIVTEMLQALGIKYVALNPGSSFRGLHDSFVNFQPEAGLETILCTHEEIAVGLAHGYYMATGKPMAAALHDVVGLQHGSMAIYNAWVDRVPVLVLGGTGPMDPQRRRPGIDWVHTALVQGNQVRDYVKWDDQPSSVGAVEESMMRGYRIAMTEPRGPVYLCFDVDVQEEAVTERRAYPDVARFRPPASPAANREALAATADALVNAAWPVILADYVGRNPAALPPLLGLAEALGAAVVDRGSKFNFPSTHELDATLAEQDAMERADVVLALDTYDIAGTYSGIKDRSAVSTREERPRTVIHITLGDLLQHSWATDYQRLHPVDIPIAADTAEALPELLRLCQERLAASPAAQAQVAERRRAVAELRETARATFKTQHQPVWDLRPVSGYRLYSELWDQIKGTDWSLVANAGRLPLRGVWDITDPAQFIGSSHGGGLGYMPTAALGAALALKDSGRVPIAIIGDGEFLMASNMLWTAARYQIPLLTIIFNNRSYYNDEGHQEYMAVSRNRPVENKGVGIQLNEPDTDFAALARSFSVAGFGPAETPEALREALAQALHVVKEQHRPALVDVVTQPR